MILLFAFILLAIALSMIMYLRNRSGNSPLTPPSPPPPPPVIVGPTGPAGSTESRVLSSVAVAYRDSPVGSDVINSKSRFHILLPDQPDLLLNTINSNTTVLEVNNAATSLGRPIVLKRKSWVQGIVTYNVNAIFGTGTRSGVIAVGYAAVPFTNLNAVTVIARMCFANENGDLGITIPFVFEAPAVPIQFIGFFDMTDVSYVPLGAAYTFSCVMQVQTLIQIL